MFNSSYSNGCHAHGKTVAVDKSSGVTSIPGGYLLTVEDNVLYVTGLMITTFLMALV
jgi:hypothetical protein